jgi:type VI protein secretion system component VasK
VVLTLLEVLGWYNGGSTAALFLDVAAIAAIVGAVTTYSRNKSALAASQAAGDAWHEERDAAVAKADRQLDALKEAEVKFAKAEARIASLETRPDLHTVEELLAALKDQQKGLIEALTEAMGVHEKNALDRADRLILAVEALHQ